MRNILLLLAAVMYLSGCANPANLVTADNYRQICSNAEDRNNLKVAEEACYRVIKNIDWAYIGNTSISQQESFSQSYYNLARIERRLGKFDEAEKLFLTSLSFEEKLPTPSQEKIGRRLAELAMLKEQQKKHQDGYEYVKRLFEIGDIYNGNERQTVAIIFYVYSTLMIKDGRESEAKELSAKALTMGFNPSMLNN